MHNHESCLLWICHAPERRHCENTKAVHRSLPSFGSRSALLALICIGNLQLLSERRLKTISLWFPWLLFSFALEEDSEPLVDSTSVRKGGHFDHFDLCRAPSAGSTEVSCHLRCLLFSKVGGQPAHQGERCAIVFANREAHE